MRAGIVLAGGAARRMGGVDKALVDVGGVTMLDRVLGALSSNCGTLVVVGPARTTAIRDVRFTVEDEPGGGPVPAVVAGLAEVPDAETAVVLAVDLPLLTGGHVARLLEAVEGGGVDAAAALDHRGSPNPLLAAYRTTVLRAALEGLSEGSAAARLLPVSTVTVDLGEAATLNVNEPDDLVRARRTLPQP